MAKRHGLTISGGSDFHGFVSGKETLIGGIDVPAECLEQLIALAEKSKVMAK